MDGTNCGTALTLADGGLSVSPVYFTKYPDGKDGYNTLETAIDYRYFIPIFAMILQSQVVQNVLEQQNRFRIVQLTRIECMA